MVLSTRNSTRPMVSAEHSCGLPPDWWTLSHRCLRLGPVPVMVPAAQGGGGYYGYWVTLDVTPGYSPDQSTVTWNVYRCIKGDPFRRFPPPSLPPALRGYGC